MTGKSKSEEQSPPRGGNLLIPAVPTPEERAQKSHAAKLALIDAYFELMRWSDDGEASEFLRRLITKSRGRPKKRAVTNADRSLLKFYRDTCRAKRDGLFEGVPKSEYPRYLIPWVAKKWYKTNKDHLSLEATETYLRRLIESEIERRIESMLRRYDGRPEHQAGRENDLHEYVKFLMEEFSLEGDNK